MLFRSAALSGCSPPLPEDAALVIDLRWVRNYPAERKSNVDTGLYWALSFLGAKLPASADILRWHGQTVTVDLGAAQVQPQSKAAWKKLLQILKSSDEYRKTGAVDIGRFVFLSLLLIGYDMRRDFGCGHIFSCWGCNVV